MGGRFLWPQDEVWPAYDEDRVSRFVQTLLSDGTVDDGGRIPTGTSIAFAPILQLRAADYPEMPFPSGADLFQLLWFPYLLELPQSVQRGDSCFDHRVYWRDSEMMGPRRSSNPEMVERHQGYFAPSSRLHPERILEYPNGQDLEPGLKRQIDRWKAARQLVKDESSLIDAGDSPIDFYNWECSVCPATKVGGHVYWVQERKVPLCTCGRAMTHLLTVSEREWGGGSTRWKPILAKKSGSGTLADPVELTGPPDLGIFGFFYLFACLGCDDTPTRAVTAR
jgi:hypothetical protein